MRGSSGLKALHAITNDRSYQLRVDLEDWNGNIFYAMYNLWPKTATNVRCMLHSAVSLFALLHCLVELIYSKFISIHIHTFILLK